MTLSDGRREVALMLIGPTFNLLLIVRTKGAAAKVPFVTFHPLLVYGTPRYFPVLREVYACTLKKYSQVFSDIRYFSIY